MQAFYSFSVLAVSFRRLAPWGKLFKLFLRHFVIRSLRQEVCQIFISVQVIRFCHFNHRIYNSTGSGSFRTGTEQPVLPADREWSDRIFTEIIRKAAMSVFQVGHQGVFPVLGIVHRFRQTAPFARALLIQPVPECIQYRLFFFKTKQIPLGSGTRNPG